jgi:cob(I)alamin adenosyltransferase
MTFPRQPAHEYERDAAQRALAALAEAESACAEINVARTAARMAGGSAANLPAGKLLLPLVLHLKKILGEPA